MKDYAQLSDEALRAEVALALGWVEVRKRFMKFDGEFQEELSGLREHSSIPHKLPEWDSEISAACELVEKIHADNDGFRLVVQETSAPRAICIAFLRSLEALK